ncbi:uncharacterized protein Z518_07999 [Rhinocladiella mackenziei CBS 650.93]|uniref:Uncharacterized protein n=1 Tax=Rhinocladiella mackenziei CBS 650.93 TaxID=1442369 RepID=A0A0D2IZM3_9EURO|nr:uncharacterized protein Z518_07999 [Rhinocladiella mackenziei CBS 650.93]KIX02060.1 hypothetical protein Z518_07999 [Rhinocladiella mackenziei CBS 650.93]
MNGFGSLEISSEAGGNSYYSPAYGGNSYTSTIVWIEARNGEPHQLHVQEIQQDINHAFPPREDSENSSSPENMSFPQPVSWGEEWLGQSQSFDSRAHIHGSILQRSHAFVGQLDLVIVGMEFVLK